MSESVQRMKNEEVKNAEVQSEFLNVLKPHHHREKNVLDSRKTYYLTILCGIRLPEKTAPPVSLIV